MSTSQSSQLKGKCPNCWPTITMLATKLLGIRRRVDALKILTKSKHDLFASFVIPIFEEIVGEREEYKIYQDPTPENGNESQNLFAQIPKSQHKTQVTIEQQKSSQESTSTKSLDSNVIVSEIIDRKRKSVRVQQKELNETSKKICGDLKSKNEVGARASQSQAKNYFPIFEKPHNHNTRSVNKNFESVPGNQSPLLSGKTVDEIKLTQSQSSSSSIPSDHKNAPQSSCLSGQKIQKHGVNVNASKVDLLSSPDLSERNQKLHTYSHTNSPKTRGEVDLKVEPTAPKQKLQDGIDPNPPAPSQLHPIDQVQDVGIGQDTRPIDFPISTFSKEKEKDGTTSLTKTDKDHISMTGEGQSSLTTTIDPEEVTESMKVTDKDGTGQSDGNKEPIVAFVVVKAINPIRPDCMI